MKRNKTVVAVCALLFVIVFAGAACSTHNDGTREQDAAPSSEPPVVEAAPTGTPSASSTPDQAPEHAGSTQSPSCVSSTSDGAPTLDSDGRSPGDTGGNVTSDAPDLPAATPPATQPEQAPSSTPTPVPERTPPPANSSAPPPAPEPEPDPVLPDPPPQTRTICNTCGADITGNVPAHGDGHLLNGEDFSYRVE